MLGISQRVFTDMLLMYSAVFLRLADPLRRVFQNAVLHSGFRDFRCIISMFITWLV